MGETSMMGTKPSADRTRKKASANVFGLTEPSVTQRSRCYGCLELYIPIVCRKGVVNIESIVKGQ